MLIEFIDEQSQAPELTLEELELVGGGHTSAGPGQAWRNANDGAPDM